MDGKTHSGTDYGKERYRGKGNVPLPPREPRGKAASALAKGRGEPQAPSRQARQQPNLGRDRAEALMRRLQGRRTPTGRAGTPPRRAPGDGPARPLTIQERGGDFLREKKGK